MHPGTEGARGRSGGLREIGLTLATAWARRRARYPGGRAQRRERYSVGFCPCSGSGAQGCVHAPRRRARRRTRAAFKARARRAPRHARPPPPPGARARGSTRVRVQRAGGVGSAAGGGGRGPCARAPAREESSAQSALLWAPTGSTARVCAPTPALTCTAPLPPRAANGLRRPAGGRHKGAERRGARPGDSGAVLLRAARAQQPAAVRL